MFTGDIIVESSSVWIASEDEVCMLHDIVYKILTFFLVYLSAILF